MISWNVDRKLSSEAKLLYREFEIVYAESLQTYFLLYMCIKEQMCHFTHLVFSLHFLKSFLMCKLNIIFRF